MAAPVVAATVVTTDGTNSSGPHTLTLPSGIASGHFLVIDISINGTRTISAGPTGFTLDKQDVDTGSTARVARYWRIADGTEGGTVGGLTFSAASRVCYTVYRITGAVTTGTPIEASATQQNNTNSSSQVTPTITTLSADTLVLRTVSLGSTKAGTGTWAASTGLGNLTTSDSDGSSAWATQASAGATGTETFSNTGGTTKGAGITSAITSAGGGGGGGGNPWRIVIGG
jgi:hypothetical protein